MKELESVVYIRWEESERSWGVRPDGGSLHLTSQDYRVFLREYWSNQPDEVPDEYSRPAGDPTSVTVSSGLFKLLKEAEHGLWVSQPRQRELEKSGELNFHGKRTG